MNDTALKFGPAWLRALSDGSGDKTCKHDGVSEKSSNFLLEKKLEPKYCYSREEFLSLFDKTLQPPPELVGQQDLYIEKTCFPLALSQVTDDEMRSWQRGVNSDVVMRARGSRPSPLVNTRGRGSSMDRGRGRSVTRGGGLSYYTRGMSFEEEGEIRRDGNQYPRGRGLFERSQSAHERDRNWGTERNGLEDWNGNNGAARGRAPYENWRAREKDHLEEESEGWRTSGRLEKWGPGRGNWNSDKEGRGWERNHESLEEDNHREDYRNDEGKDHKWHRSYGAGGKTNKESNSVLPEWALDDPNGEVGGTFDSSGAFHGGEMDTETELETKTEIKPITDEEIEEKEVKSKPVTPSKSEVQVDNLEEEPMLEVPKEEAKNHQEEIWYYKDPQGRLQGPFASSAMSEWYDAGYFDSSLLVRRDCDKNFCQLGGLMKTWGRVPFIHKETTAPQIATA